MRIKLSILAVVFTAFFGAQSALADVITNGGFETGDFTGWTVSGTATNTNNPANFYGVDTYDAFAGSFGAYLSGEPGTVISISQTLTVVPNTKYVVGFDLQNNGGPVLPGFINSFSLSIGGTSIFSESNAPAGAYTPYSFVYTAPVGATTELLQVSAENDASFFSLDGVSVSAVPEPVSLLLFASAAGVVAVLRRRRSK